MASAVAMRAASKTASTVKVKLNRTVKSEILVSGKISRPSDVLDPARSLTL